jgi:hypothetical protein
MTKLAHCPVFRIGLRRMANSSDTRVYPSFGRVLILKYRMFRTTRGIGSAAIDGPSDK